MKKPPKSILLGYLVWCAVHILIGFSTLIDGKWDIDEDIWPFASFELNYRYDIVEVILYCGLPIVIWYFYSKIISKHYGD